MCRYHDGEWDKVDVEEKETGVSTLLSLQLPKKGTVRSLGGSRGSIAGVQESRGDSSSSGLSLSAGSADAVGKLTSRNASSSSRDCESHSTVCVSSTGEVTSSCSGAVHIDVSGDASVGGSSDASRICYPTLFVCNQ